MNILPASPSLDHLKKQAKHLLRDAHDGQADALTRFIDHLPAVHGLSFQELAGKRLLLHDAQSVVAREYGFKSWPELKGYVEWKAVDREVRLATWLRWTYEGNARQRRLALRMLAEEPEFFARDPRLACALGDEVAVRAAVEEDAGWVNRLFAGPLAMPPLVAVTHSLLILEPVFEPGLLGCARLLLAHGADANGFRLEGEWRLSALYGAAGKTHHAAMTKLLLEAGASPDDNESLYHSVETMDSTCTRLLLDAGAKVNGTNALGRVLDYEKVDDLRAMLAHGGDANERAWVHHAILRGRSMEVIRTLMDAGADLRRRDDHGLSLFRCAVLHGREDVLAVLRGAGIDEALDEQEAFIAACAVGDTVAAKAFGVGMTGRLSEMQLQALPQMAATGNVRAVETMIAVGWPLEVKMGWSATALNHAAFRGDAVIAGILLAAGADWRTLHGYKDNVLGTLSWASQDEARDNASPADYVGCARALLESDVPVGAFESYSFSAEVNEFLDRVRLGGVASEVDASPGG